MAGEMNLGFEAPTESGVEIHRRGGHQPQTLVAEIGGGGDDVVHQSGADGSVTSGRHHDETGQPGARQRWILDLAIGNQHHHPDHLLLGIGRRCIIGWGAVGGGIGDGEPAEGKSGRAGSGAQFGDGLGERPVRVLVRPLAML